MAVVSHPEAARRVRAARAYGGYGTAQELADAIAERGLGRTNLYAIERERRALRRPEAWLIAEACGLPMAFFEVNFDRLHELVAEVTQGGPPTLSPEQGEAAEDLVRAIEEGGEEHGTPHDEPAQDDDARTQGGQAP